MKHMLTKCVPWLAACRTVTEALYYTLTSNHALAGTAYDCVGCASFMRPWSCSSECLLLFLVLAHHSHCTDMDPVHVTQSLDLHSLQRYLTRLWWQMPEPPHILHTLLLRLCSHIADPPHSLHWLLTRLWWQMLAPPHTLHTLQFALAWRGCCRRLI